MIIVVDEKTWNVGLTSIYGHGSLFKVVPLDNSWIVWSCQEIEMSTTTTTIKSYKGLKSIQSNANRVQYNDIISKRQGEKKRLRLHCHR